MNNTFLLKKQLLDAKNLIAELREEKTFQGEKIIDLETKIINFEETNKELLLTKQNFMTTVQIEKNKLQDTQNKTIREYKHKILQLEKQLENKDIKLNSLEDEIKRKNLQIFDQEEKIKSVLEQNYDLEGLEVMDLMKQEQEEKIKLHQKIIVQTEQLSELQKQIEKVVLENQKLRAHFKVPDSFGENFDVDIDSKTLSQNSVNKDVKIKYLEKEIETLEEERAKLKCQLRQVFGMINQNGQNTILSGLNEEKQHAVQVYALSLKQDNYEIPLNDKSKELQKKCDQLEAQLDIYKNQNQRDNKQIQELLQEISNQRQNQSKTPRNFDNFVMQNNIVSQNVSVEENTLQSSRENLQKIQYKKHIENLKNMTDSNELKIYLIQTLIQFEAQKNQKEYYQKQNEQLKEDFNIKKQVYKSKIKQLQEEIKNFQDKQLVTFKEKQELENTKSILEKQIQNLQIIIKKDQQDNEYNKIIVDNDLLYAKNIYLNSQVQILQLQLDIYSKQNIKQINDIQSLSQDKEKEIQQLQEQILQQEKKIKNLLLDSINTIPLEQYRLLQYQNCQIQDELLQFKQTKIKDSQIENQLIQSQIELENVLKSLNYLRDENDMLIFESKQLQNILSEQDEEYAYFFQLLQRLYQNIIIMSNEEPLRYLKQQQNKINDKFITNIFDKLNQEITIYEIQLIKKYLFINNEDQISYNDIIHKMILIKHFTNNVQDNEIDNIFQQLYTLDQDMQEIFNNLDYNNDGKIYYNQFYEGCQNMQLNINKLHLKLFYQSYLGSDDQYLTKQQFYQIYKCYRNRVEKNDFYNENQISEFQQTGVQIYQFLEQNKQDFKDFQSFFNFIDDNQKGYINLQDFEKFFISKLQMDFGQKFIEDLFLSIDKNIQDKLFQHEFQNYLTRCIQYNQIQQKLEMKIDFITTKEFTNRQEVQLINLKEKIQYLMQQQENSKFQIIEQQQLLKQKQLTICNFQQKLQQQSEDLKFLKQDLKNNKEELIQIKEKEINDINIKKDFYQQKSSQQQSSSEISNYKNLYDNLLNENSNLQFQIGKLQDQMLQLNQQLVNEVSQDQQKQQEVQFLYKYLQNKYDHDEDKKKINNYESKINTLNNKFYEYKDQKNQEIDQMEDLIKFLAQRINILQRQVIDQDTQKLITIDSEKIDSFLHKYQQQQDEITNIQTQYLELKQKYQTDQLKLNKDSVKQKNQLYLQDLLRIKNDNILLDRIQDLLEQNNQIVIEKMQIQNQQELNEEQINSLNSKNQKQNQMIKNLELQIKNNLNQLKKREVYWSKKVKQILEKKDFIKYTNTSRLDTEQTPLSPGISSNRSRVQNKYNDLLQKIEQLEKEKNELNNHLNEVNSKKNLENLQNDIQNKKVSYNAQRDQQKILSATQQTVKLLQTVIEEKNLENNELNEEIKLLESKIQTLSNDKVILEMKVDNLELNGQLKNAKNFNKENFLKNKIEEQIQSKKHDNLQIIADQYKQRIQILEKDYKELQTINQDLIEQLKKLNAKNQEILINFQDTDLINLNNKNKQKKKQIAKLEKQNLELTQSLQTIKNKYNQKDIVIEEVKKQNHSNLANFQSRQNNIQQKFKTQKFKTQVLKKQIQDLQQTCEDLKQENQELQQKYSTLNKKNIDINLILMKKKTKIKQLKKQVTSQNLLQNKEQTIKNSDQKNDTIKKQSSIQNIQIEEKQEEIPVQPITETLKNIKENQNLIDQFEDLHIKSNKSQRFFSFEEFIIALKNKLLNDKLRLAVIAKQMSSIYKDIYYEKLPEKILDLLKAHKIHLTLRDQKNFIQWFLKYNKQDFFQNFYNNIMLLDENQIINNKESEQSIQPIQQQKINNNLIKLQTMTQKQFDFQIETLNKKIKYYEQKFNYYQQIIQNLPNQYQNIKEDQQNQVKDIVLFTNKEDQFFLETFKKYEKIKQSYLLQEIQFQKNKLNQRNKTIKLLKETKGDKFTLNKKFIQQKDKEIQILKKQIKIKNIT